MNTGVADAIATPTLPERQGMDDAVRFLLECAMLAPSSHDTQPWELVARGNTVEVRADLGRWLRVADPQRRELYISLGCALENLLIAAERLGFGHEIVFHADADRTRHAATVTLLAEGAPSSCRPAELFDAIPDRAADRKRCEPRPVGEAVLAEFRECATDPGIGLWLTADPVLLARLGALGETPIVGVLHSRRDDRESQIRVGQAFERLALLATNRGLAVQPLSHLVEVAEIRRELQGLLPEPGMLPQHVFRVGYADREAISAPPGPPRPA